MKNILFFLHKIGPYHHARFNALAEVSNLTVVEILPESIEYDWNKIVEEKKYQTQSIEEHRSGKEEKRKKLKIIINRIFSKIQPDFCIVTGWDNKSYYTALIESKQRNIPCICISDSTYNDSKRIWYKELLKSKLINAFDGFLVAGKLSQEYLLKLKVNTPIEKPWDVVDNNYFSKSISHNLPYKLPEKFFLCISRFIWEKNLSTLIKAFISFKKENPLRDEHLVIVGSGPLKNEIQNLIESNPYNNVILLPFAQYHEITSLYKLSEALILPSVKDTWGLVVNEAMSAGVPVLVSEKCGCVPDLIEEGKSGLIFKPDKDSIKRTLNIFINLTYSQKKLLIENAGSKINEYNLKNFTNAIESLSHRTTSNKMNALQKLIISAKLKC